MDETDSAPAGPSKRALRGKPPAGERTGAPNVPAAAAARLESAHRTMIQLFMGCFFVGFFVAALGLLPSPFLKNVGLFGPIGATIAYPLIGMALGIHKKPSLVEKFADNCYYLGFIFTQAALLFAFLPLAVSDRVVESTDLLRFFGMAIGAALAGLIARTWFIQTSLNAPEVDDILHHEIESLARDVGRAARKILNEFDGLAAKVAEIPVALGAKLEAQVDSIAGNLSQYDRALEEGIRGMRNAGRSVEGNAEAAAQAMASRNDALAGEVHKVAQILNQLQQAMTARVTESVELIRASTESIATGVGALQGFTALESGIDKLKTEVADIAEVAARVRTISADVTASLEVAAGEAAQRLDATSAEASTRISAAASQAAQRLETTSIGASSQISEAAGGAIQRLETTTAGASSQISAAVSGAAQRLESTSTDASSKIAGAAGQAASSVAAAADETRSLLVEKSDRFSADVTEAATAFSEVLAAFETQLARLRGQHGSGT